MNFADVISERVLKSTTIWRRSDVVHDTQIFLFPLAHRLPYIDKIVENYKSQMKYSTTINLISPER